MGRFSSSKDSEGREYLKVCTLSLGIRVWAPTVPRSQVRSKGLSDKGAPGRGPGHLRLFPSNVKAGAGSLVTLEAGAYRGLGEGLIPNVRS